MSDGTRGVQGMGPGPEVQGEVLGGGITNQNLKVDVGGESLVLRVAGKNTDLLGIDREAELAATEAAAAAGAGPGGGGVGAGGRRVRAARGMAGYTVRRGCPPADGAYARACDAPARRRCAVRLPCRPGGPGDVRFVPGGGDLSTDDARAGWGSAGRVRLGARDRRSHRGTSLGGRARPLPQRSAERELPLRWGGGRDRAVG